MAGGRQPGCRAAAEGHRVAYWVTGARCLRLAFFSVFAAHAAACRAHPTSRSSLQTLRGRSWITSNSQVGGRIVWVGGDWWGGAGVLRCLLPANLPAFHSVCSRSPALPWCVPVSTLHGSIPRCCPAGITWTHDNKGFFYARYEEAQTADKGTETHINLGQQVMYHVLGTPQSADVTILADPQHPTWMFGTEVTHDGRWVPGLMGGIGRTGSRCPGEP